MVTTSPLTPREPDSNTRFTGERALFRARDARLHGAIFADGESPLKESSGARLDDSVFEWKYPLWYATKAEMTRSALLETARSGIWYADGVDIRDSTIAAPKTFRRSTGIHLEHVDMPHADETLWSCRDIELVDVSARGDYFGMNSSGISARGLSVTGNYAFDGASDIEISDARILSKDAFWNTRDVTVRDSLIVGEYLGWNSTHLTFENCTIESLQALCYIDGVTLRNCRLVNTTLAFEFSTVDVHVTTSIDSVFNPRGGVIRARSISDLTLDPTQVDPSATSVITGTVADAA